MFGFVTIYDLMKSKLGIVLVVDTIDYTALLRKAIT